MKPPTSLALLPQPRRRPWARALTAAAALLLAGVAGAQTTALATPAVPAVPAVPAAAAAAATPELLPEPAIQAMETTRQGTRDATDWLARRVDSWFGDRPFEQGGKVTGGRLALELFHRSDQKTRLDLRFSAQFKLPNVERYAYLFIGRDDPRAVIQDTPDAFNRRQQLQATRPGDRSVLAGLGLILPQNVGLRVGVGAGLKPYVQARYSKPWTLAPGHQLDFRETLFWTSADQFGSTTALTYDHALSPTLVLRWLNAATITQQTQNFEWSSGLGAYKAFPGLRLLSLEALLNGTGRHGQGVGSSDIGLLAKWEQPLHQDWLLGELVAGHFWPKPDAQSPRGKAWALGANLKMLF